MVRPLGQDRRLDGFGSMYLKNFLIMNLDCLFLDLQWICNGRQLDIPFMRNITVLYPTHSLEVIESPALALLPGCCDFALPPLVLTLTCLSARWYGWGRGTWVLASPSPFPSMEGQFSTSFASPFPLRMTLIYFSN
jgi:hypothetical protein